MNLLYKPRVCVSAQERFFFFQKSSQENIVNVPRVNRNMRVSNIKMDKMNRFYCDEMYGYDQDRNPVNIS